MRSISTVFMPALFVASVTFSGYAQEVIRVQFEPNAAFAGRAPVNFTGVESSAAAAYAGFGTNGSNTWNYLSLPPNVISTNPSFTNLVDSAGVATGVGISFTGSITAANDTPDDTTGSDALENNYFLVDGGGSTSTTAGFSITGLPPNRTVYLYLYAPNFAHNDSNNPTDQPSRGYTLTLNGEPISVSSGSSDNALATATTNASGTISGTWSTNGNEGDWSGLQIALPAVTQATAVFPHVAADTMWQTDFVILNTGTTSVSYTLVFHSDSGATTPIAGIGAVTQVSGVIAPHGTAFYTTDTTVDSDGWAELDSATPLTGVAVFREANDQTSVQLETPSTSFTMPYDSTAPPNAPNTPYVDGLAITNVDPNNQATITCQAYDINGTAIGGSLTGLVIPPLGHTAFLLQSTAPFTALPADTRGQLVCSSTTDVAAIELRALGAQVSTMPVVQ